MKQGFSNYMYYPNLLKAGGSNVMYCPDFVRINELSQKRNRWCVGYHTVDILLTPR